MKTAAKSVDADRKRDLAAIHLMAAQLGMDTHDRNPRCDYRAMLMTHGAAVSAADMDRAARKRVVRHLAQCLNTKRTPSAPGQTQQALIETLWSKLGDAGALRDPSASGLAALIKRLHGVDNARWLTAMQGSKVIEALKSMHARHAKPTAP